MSKPPADASRGLRELDDPMRNKGTAFSAGERRDLGLEGLLPPAVETIETQRARALDHLARRPNDLERYVYLVVLCGRNATLFDKTPMSDPARFAPIGYDPTIAGSIAAPRISNRKLKDRKMFLPGTGSAGIGIADTIVAAMVDAGLDRAAAEQRISLFDAEGRIEPAREDLSPSQKIHAHAGDTPTRGLEAAVNAEQPTVPIGVSTGGGAFTENVVKAMAGNADRPIVVPLSNPTDKAGCTPEQADNWTDGGARRATFIFDAGAARDAAAEGLRGHAKNKP